MANSQSSWGVWCEGYAWVMARALLIALCCLPLFLSLVTVAQDRAKKAKEPEKPAAPEPRKYTQDEIDAADEALRSLTPENRALLNNLRYLLRPSFETELMVGLNYRPCMLAPLEAPVSAPPSTLEIARLWAIVASGMEATEPVLQALDRVLAAKLPVVKESLGDCGLRMALCAAALRRPELGRADKLLGLAEACLKFAMRARTTTESQSPLIKGEYISAGWFANHMWQALMCRIACELKLKFNERVWEASARVLSNVGATTVEGNGWASKRGGYSSPLEDLDTNLFAFVAMSFARGAPEGTLGTAALRGIDKDLKHVSRTLTRLEAEYPAPLVGTRLAMVRSLSPDFSPEGRKSEVWQQVVLDSALDAADRSGMVVNGRGVAHALGIDADEFSLPERRVICTAMSCIALSGGMLPDGAGPLRGMSMGEIGRAMHALAVLHAAALPPQGGLESSPEIEAAIQRGCEFLESVQANDGHFPGRFEGTFGNTAVAMLAMMHGGYDRDSHPIKNGMDWVCGVDANTVTGGDAWRNAVNSTYSDALVLLMFQKYYEREQQASGILWADTPAEFETARVATWSAISKRHREVIEALVKRLNGAFVEEGDGYWGYGLGGAHQDNSNTQFAILAYKAASLLGAGISTKRIEHEARRLVKRYKFAPKGQTVSLNVEENGKRSSSKSGSIQIGGWGYNEDHDPTIGMTAAGVSSLAVCRDELKIRGALDRDLERSVALTLHGAQHWMATNYYEERDGNYFHKRIKDWTDSYYDFDGVGLYYDLYSIERACVLAGLETIGFDVDWYAVGARGLLATQRKQGDWTLPVPKGMKSRPEPQTINTAWAILFLKKAAPPIVADPKLRQPKPIVPPSPTTGDPKPREPDAPVTGK